MITPTLSPSDAELLAQYAAAGLAELGIDYASALAIPGVRTALACAVDAHRRMAARRARGAAIERSLQEAA